MMSLTQNQVFSLAPDAASAQAGKKQAQVKLWKNLGRTAQVLWGECQGSALYQVRVDLGTLAVKCSCPSRKFPCKHGLGLMLLSLAGPAALPAAAPPQWVTDWLARRAAPAAKATAKQVAKPPEQAAAEAAKRASKRETLILAGLDALDLWLDDLVRTGLAGLESQSAKVWEAQAARIVDAQAGGLASRLRRLGGIPNASKDWPSRLLGELGKLALLTHAYRHVDALPDGLREDVRELIGWNLGVEQVDAHGDAVTDDWAVLGQWIDDDEKLRVQRTWLLGTGCARMAMVVQFSAAHQPFGETFAAGRQFTGTLRFWPGAVPLRARVAERTGEAAPITARMPGTATIEGALRTHAAALARQPWLDRSAYLLQDVVPVCQAGGVWWLRDRQGQALQLSGQPHWLMLALSGGHPVDVAGEWDGETLLPLGLMTGQTYTALCRES
jgi:hypothetical protein